MDIKLPELDCTGCGACMQTCKVGAITRKPREDGFLYPVIDTEKCVQCGQCMKSCHALGWNRWYQPTVCYAAQVSQQDVLKISTSGGMFHVLASSILQENGVVYGCIFDAHCDAVIVRGESLEQIAPMHGSKYVWSDPSASYPMVKQDLESGRKVLYTGLPCQAAGLRKYLRKQYENLFLVDTLCLGAPSPYAFQRYLETLTDEEGKKDLQFQFRDKERFGCGVDCTYIINGRKHYETRLENGFYYAFSAKVRLSWRKSCYRCNYKSIYRVSDMTVGDYWGVEKHHSTFDPKDGVSVVLINTKTGAKLYEQVKQALRYEESNVLYATERNSLVTEIEKGHISIPTNRDAFFHTLQSDGWKKADRKFLKKRNTLRLKIFLYGVYRKLRRILKG